MTKTPKSWQKKHTGFHRFGFNGKENDNEVKGTGNQQDYGMRIYDARLGKFLSVDPITKKYPMLTPYQFASNTPISGIDMDGLEYVFAADGSFLGQKTGFNESIDNSVVVADKVDIANGRITGISNPKIAYSDMKGFREVLGAVYNETDDKAYTWKEAAGIYDVMENRLEGNLDQNTMYKVLTETGVHGWDKDDAKHIRNEKVDFTALSGSVVPGGSKGDRIDPTKFKEVTKGVLAAMTTANTEQDYSGGSTTWHGTDFAVKGSKANDDYYKDEGFRFTDKSHDTWKMGDHANKSKSATHSELCGKKTITHTVSYKYESTGAEGGSIFIKRTAESINAEYRPCNQNHPITNGKAVW